MPKSREQIRAAFLHISQHCSILSKRLGGSSEYYKGQIGLNRICSDFITYTCALSEIRRLVYEARASNFHDLESQLDFFMLVMQAELDRAKVLKDKLLEEFPEGPVMSE